MTDTDSEEVLMTANGLITRVSINKAHVCRVSVCVQKAVEVHFTCVHKYIEKVLLEQSN